MTRKRLLLLGAAASVLTGVIGPVATARADVRVPTTTYLCVFHKQPRIDICLDDSLLGLKK